MSTPKRQRGVPDSYTYNYYTYINENKTKADDIKKKAQNNFENQATNIYVDRYNQRFEEQKELENQGHRIEPDKKIYAKVNKK